MKLNSNRLTFEETDRFKGLLILLIVFGHISQLLQQYGSLHATLYSFHVVSFLLLPFLFNRDHLTVQNIKKSLRRIYIPYTLFFLLSLTAFSLMEHHFDVSSALMAWSIGSSALLKVATGFRIFWFFPALLSTILLLMIYNRLSTPNKKVLFIMALIAHFLIPFIPKSYLFYFPLSSYISLYLFSIGIMVKYLYDHWDYRRYKVALSIGFILLLLLSYGSDFSLASAIFPNIIENPLYFLLQDGVMIVSFFTLILWSSKMKFLESFGKYSLAIFTIHPFIIQVINKLYPWESFMEGLIKFVIVLLTTYLVVRVLYWIKIDTILYPR